MNYTRLKLACYSTNISMSVVGNLPPLLFLTFRNLYGLSYSLLGLLVVINFFTQLIVDLIFSFFSHKFNIPKTVKFTPVLTFTGLAIYALSPFIFKDNVFIGLVLGTIIFSSASGLSEVLISPVIAAIPAKDPDREMSKLHSVYAWGVVFVVIFSTLFIYLLGSELWQILVLIFMLVPVIAGVLYFGTELPEMETPERVSGALNYLKNKTVWACVLCIFLGGAAECTMAQWSSGYLEQALGIPKALGDVFGVALFGVTLGIGRSLYAKIGKNIEKVLLLGALGATACYLISAVSPFPILGLFASGFTGFCVSMLWPGSLIVAADRVPGAGVFIYALMAAGGDFGASVGPQLVGIVTDMAMVNESALKLATTLGMTAEQLGMRFGMLVGMLFPLCAIPLYFRMMRSKKQ